MQPGTDRQQEFPRDRVAGILEPNTIVWAVERAHDQPQTGTMTCRHEDLLRLAGDAARQSEIGCDALAKGRQACQLRIAELPRPELPRAMADEPVPRLARKGVKRGKTELEGSRIRRLFAQNPSWGRRRGATLFRRSEPHVDECTGRTTKFDISLFRKDLIGQIDRSAR